MPPIEEIVTAVHSALSWRRFHGPVTLYADTSTARYFHDHGLADIYDSIRTSEVDGIDTSRFSPTVYFSLPKIVALRHSAAPVAILDLDFFLRGPIRPPGDREFVFAHHETLDRRIYPRFTDLTNPHNLQFPGWRDDLPACNMAFAAFGSQAHLDAYTESALAYAEDNAAPGDLHPVARVTFAEQRLVAYWADRLGLTMRPLTASTWDVGAGKWTRGEPDAMFHHTWHAKRLLDPSGRDRLRARLVQELLDRFPDAARLLAGVPELGPFLRRQSPRSATAGTVPPATPDTHPTTPHRSARQDQQPYAAETSPPTATT
ncbi:hypothetical protein [Micromonospora inyonensis]|uniref:Uncharacterized protein n=1 Tax=Micromonospora inyonensis TaxID=47866 RepID=A0A1C6RLS5_9ACTN|nr:hypothetical protein [Micromonospora inyonensis]SCL17984.1 hypothetical protein GA0074694_2197 [Micromonospora inyonensis]